MWHRGFLCDLTHSSSFSNLPFLYKQEIFNKKSVVFIKLLALESYCTTGPSVCVLQ